MVNHVTVGGRIVKDPELRVTSNSVSVVSFRIACERDFKGKSGEKETDFIDCIAYRQQAEFINQYVQKGELMVVSGRLQVRNWEDKQGNKRTSTEVICDNVYPMEWRKSGNSGGSGRTAESYTPTFTPANDDDGDLPF